MKYNFLNNVDNSIFFNGEFMEIYIPKEYFKWEIAEFQGEYLSTIGIFDFITYLNPKESKNKGDLHILKLPMTIKFGFSSFHDASLSLSSSRDKEDYTVFELKKGDLFVDNLFKEQSAENTKKFISLLHGGKLPSVLKYSDIINLYLDSVSLNHVKLNNVSVIYEMCIAELCRYKGHIDIPFRMVADKSNISPYDYENINIKKLPSINSTFNAMTFEDVNQSIISSIKKTKNNEQENISPVEKIIKY